MSTLSRGTEASESSSGTLVVDKRKKKGKRGTGRRSKPKGSTVHREKMRQRAIRAKERRQRRRDEQQQQRVGRGGASRTSSSFPELAEITEEEAGGK